MTELTNTKDMLQQEVEKGNERANEYQSKIKQHEENEAKLVASGKTHSNDNGDIVFSTDEMSIEQIGEVCEEQKNFNEIQEQILNEFPPDIPDADDNDIELYLNSVADATNEYNQKLDEKIEEMKEQPERAVAIGGTIIKNSDKISQGYEDIMQSSSKEELEMSTSRLAKLYEYGKTVLDRHTRQANNRDEKFTVAIEEFEETIKTYQKDIEKNLKEKENLDKELEEIKKEKEILEALIVIAKDEVEKKEYEEELNKCNDYINEMHPYKIEEIDKIIKKDEEQIKNMSDQVEHFKEIRLKIRKDRWKPAAMVVAAYDKLTELTPPLIDKLQDINKDFHDYKVKNEENYEDKKQQFINDVNNVKETISNELNVVQAKSSKKVRSIKNWIGEKILNVVEKVTKKIDTWIDKKVPEKTTFLNSLNNLPNVSKERLNRKEIRNTFEIPWKEQHGTPINQWDLKKAYALVDYLTNRNKNHQNNEKQAVR